MGLTFWKLLKRKGGATDGGRSEDISLALRIAQKRLFKARISEARDFWEAQLSADAPQRVA